MVSEFAARCPTCRHPVDDAIELPEPPTEPPPPTESPAAAEPEPGLDQASGPIEGRARRHRRFAAAGAGLVLAIPAILLASDGRAASSPALASLSGEVAARSPAGATTWVDPIGGRSLVVPPPKGFRGMDPLAVSSDGATLLDSDGTLLTVDDGSEVARPTPITALLSAATSPAQPTAFADGNRAVLLLTRTGPQAATAALVDLSDDRQVDLGPVDSAGADPLSLGAFVSAPTASGGAEHAIPALSDARIELRMAGRGPALLATAGDLDRAVGWPPDTPVRMDVYPNSTGDAVAVVLHRPGPPPGGDIPIVILNRQGALLAVLTNGSGLSSGSQPRWSPGGHQIAYPTSTRAGPALTISTETGAPETYPAPSSTTFGSCIWSPASTDVVCQSRIAGRARWLYATPTAGHLISTRSVGEPLTWLALLPPSRA